MSKILVLVFIFCALVAFAGAEELYSDKYDYIDADAILSNDKIRSEYYNCLMDSELCRTPVALFMKEVLPEALITKCRRCTPKQKVIVEKIVTFYVEKQPQQWERLILKIIDDSKQKGSGKQ